ncbi:MAG: transglutaminase-like domain-containing protein [Clostridia bacterium]|nr:transglutaminase-like domain-containing protein [Clostridia bacterium]
MTKSEKIKLKQRNLRSLHAGDQRLEPWMTPVGLILRCLVPALLTIGLYLFTDNAFGLASPKAVFVPLIIVCSALGVFMRYSRIVCAVGWVGILGGIGTLFALSGMDPLTYTVTLARSFFNTAVSYMMHIGYRTLYVFLIDTELEEAAEAGFAVIFFGIVTALIALIVGACCAKRVKVFPLALIIGIDYFVIFMYNISTSKWGFALSLAGIVGILCQKMADKAAVYAEPDAKEGEGESMRDVFAQPQTADSIAAESVPEAPKKAKKEKKAKKPLTDEEKDALKAKRKRDLRSYAVGGICSFFASILMLAILAIPASRVKNIWRTYESIDTIMETIRAYEMAIITGEDMQITDLGLTGAAEILEARSAIAQPRYFTGKPVLEIQSNTSTAIYLRSWISSTFKEDRWYVADDSQRSAFKAKFGTDFRAESITYRFFRNLNEKLVRYNSPTSYVNHEDDGYVTSLVSIKNLGVSGNILFLPERFDSERSLFDYGSIETPYQKRWINYFDGIAYSRAFHKGAKYSAVAYLPLYKDEEWMENLNFKRYDYDRFCALYEYLGDTIALYEADTRNVQLLIDAYGAMSDEERAVFEKEMNEVFAYNEYVQDSGIYTSMPEDAALYEPLHELAVDIICSEPLADIGIPVPGDTSSSANGKTVKDVLPELQSYDYTDYLYYISTMLAEYREQFPVDDTEDEDAPERGDITFPGPFLRAEEVRGSDHSLIDVKYYITDFESFRMLVPDMITYYYPHFTRCVAKYLAENMTYTLNPEPPEEGDTLSSVERFLFVTKEGYCVQYATAATLMLRTLGVPTRYVEGYIAPKMVRNNPENPEDKVGNYIGTVRDYNAHAWVEIYLPNYGWLMQEVTTPYYSTMNDPYERLTYTPHESTYTPSTEVIEEEEEEEEEEETLWDTWGDLIITLGIILAVAAVVFVILNRYLAVQAGKRFRHESNLRNAKRDLLNDEQRKTAAEELYDTMRKTVKQFGMKPVKGETPESFARRLDMRFPVTETGASIVLSIIEKNEFGEGITNEEIAEFAEYITRLEDKIRGEAGFFKMFTLKYVLGLM